MKVNILGGGPGGLYSAILLKATDPTREVVLHERNRPDDTFGFGVVFSDATMAELESAEPGTYREIVDAFAHWDDIDIHYGGEVLRSGGHGFAGLSRMRLLQILQRRAVDHGVQIHFESDIENIETLRDADLVIAADGVNSATRDHYAEVFQPDVDFRPNRFVWLGTTRPFDAFTFFFRETEHGLWRVHAYQYEDGQATFIVEAREETWRASALPEHDEDAARDFCAKLFAEELRGHPLLTNRSVWRQFPTVRNGCWSHENVVLLGDAAHTAHFSVGSGTRIAMLDAIALTAALGETDDMRAAFASYEEERRPQVESLQRAAQTSLQWFEDTERYMSLAPIQFGFTLLTRSLRITHENLRARDSAFVDRVDRWFAGEAETQSGEKVLTNPPPPPMFTPFKLRDMVLANRVAVSPMCQYSAADGTPNDWHLVHLGSRAVGGAGLVIAEMTDVCRDGRISPGCTGLYSDEHAGAWGRIVDFIHTKSPAKVGIQLGHAGRKGATQVLWEGPDEPLESGSWDLVSASPIPYLPQSQVPKEMTRADMDEAQSDYVRAAEIADEAGFDMLEVHMAHGYLLATFLSPLTNERDDEYGGSLENRMRFPLEVFDAVRLAWPDEKPISVRISAVDWKPGGMQPEDAVEVSRMLEAHDCDIVDVSAGQTVSDQQPVYGRLFQTPFSDRIRHEVGIHTMAVGNISSYMDVNTILAAGRADLCLLARAHLFDPYWTRHAAYTLGYDLEWPDPYKSVTDYTARFAFDLGATEST
ncbi:MAG: bifunctional salicylyl-CoA 5-hydroxylase/oxidoreductase [Gemmatimonadota bacterium]|nr:MAG: bifunctional salicylyl-CoA 5-hydroxylase/oxidoreductase [Gemmatimonadota bacterium]